MPEHLIKQTLNKNWQAKRQINVQPAILQKINSGQLQIAPRRSLVMIKRLLFATQFLILGLNLAALTVFVRELFLSDTFVFGQEFSLAAAEYRDVAWAALIESVPWFTFGLALAALIGLLFVFYLGRSLKRGLLTN